MATVLADVATLAADTGFRSRVAAGMAYKAGFIGTETLAMVDPTVIDKLRLVLALNILVSAGASKWIDPFVWALASEPSIADATVSDGTILSSIDAFWNLMAGVTV